jgi:hypothetical protein
MNKVAHNRLNRQIGKRAILYRHSKKKKRRKNLNNQASLRKMFKGSQFLGSLSFAACNFFDSLFYKASKILLQNVFG